jgi:antitoxin CptB
MNNKEILKKQIIYRSMHRGFKEMDLLLGSFVKKYINEFDEVDLLNLEKLLNIDDEIIYKWYFENKINNNIPKTKVLDKLKNFKL